MTSTRLGLALLVLLAPIAAFAEGRELGPRGGGPTSYGAYRPLTGHSSGRFLTLWREYMGYIGAPIMGALSDGDGRRLSPISFPVALPGEPADIVGTSEGFAIFSMKGELTEVDLDGGVIRTRSLALPAAQTLRAQWNGSRFLVVTIAPFANDSRILLLDRDGKVLHGPIALPDGASDCAIVSTANGFALVASGPRGVSAYRVTNEGAVTQRLIDSRGNTLRAVVAATETGDLGVVWLSNAGFQGVLNFAVVTPDGVIRQSRVLLEGPASPLALVQSGGSFLVAYRRGALIESLIVDSGSPVLVASDVYEATAATGNDRIFVAYTPSKIFPLRILSAVLTSNGAAQRDIVSYSRTRQTQPALSAGGGRFLAAWSDVTGEAAFVRAAAVGLDAQPLSDHVVAPAYLAARDLAWNGFESLAVAVRDERLLATRLAYDGRPIDSEPSVVDASAKAIWSPSPVGAAELDTSAAVAWAGDRWLVAWPGGDGLRFAAVSRAGEPTSPPRDLVLTSPLGADDYRANVTAALLANDTTTLLVWTEEQRPRCFFPICRDGVKRTFAARMSKTGQLLDAVPLEIPPATTISGSTSGREFLVLGDTTARVIDASATPRLIASRRVLDWSAKGDVTWDGSSYAVALRYQGLRWHLSVTHLDRSATPVGTTVGTPTLAPDAFVAPSIAGIVPSSALVAVNEGDAQNGTRAVVYAEREMTPLPAPPSPPRDVQVTRVTGAFEVEWKPSQDGEVELYRVEGLSYGGTWAVVGTVAPTEPLRVRSFFETVRVIAFNAGGPSEPASNRARRRTARP